jgi:hypothetical protein
MIFGRYIEAPGASVAAMSERSEPKAAAPAKMTNAK